MSNDTERLFEAHLFSHYLYASPMFVLAMLILLALEIGPAAVIGFGLLLLVLPLQVSSNARVTSAFPLPPSKRLYSTSLPFASQAHLGRVVGHAKHRMLAATDERTEHMSEAIKGVQVMKVGRDFVNWCPSHHRNVGDGSRALHSSHHCQHGVPHHCACSSMAGRIRFLPMHKRCEKRRCVISGPSRVSSPSCVQVNLIVFPQPALSTNRSTIVSLVTRFKRQLYCASTP